MPPAPPETEAGVAPAGQAAERALSALLELGAGSLNQLYGQVALFGLGEQPRFRLRFLHDTLDGMGGEPPGSGFNLRQDDLQGGLKFDLGKLGLNLDGGLREEERGLQGRGSFVSRVVRSGTLSAELAWPFAEHWTLVGSLIGDFASQLLTALPSTATPLSLDEVQASPKLALEWRTERFWMAVDGRYSLRAYDGEPSQRASAVARFGVDVSKALRVEGSGGWQWGSLYGHLFPFSLSLTVTPASSFSIAGLRGLPHRGAGRAHAPGCIPLGPAAGADRRRPRLVRRPHRDLHPPAGLHPGGRGCTWPGRRRRRGRRSPCGGRASGLYLLDQVAAARAAVQASLRWTPARETYLSAGWRMELADHPAFSPGTELRLEGGVAGKRWGGHGSFVVQLGYAPAPPDFTLTPVLSLGGFFQASEAVRLNLELEDLLSPLGGPRLDWDPFVAPGIRGIFKVQINL